MVIRVAAGFALLFSAMAPAEPPATTRPAGLNDKLLAMPDNSWLKLSPPREPGGRNFCGACFGGGRVFYFGGAELSYQGNDVELYDPAANRWTQSWPPDPRPPQDFSGAPQPPEVVFDAGTGRLWPVRTHQQVCHVPDRGVFVYAGHVGTWQFDPAANKWTSLAGPHSEGRKFTPHTPLAGQTYHTFYCPRLKAVVCIVTAKPFGIYLFDLQRGEWARRAKDIPDRMKWFELYSTYVASAGRHLLSQRGEPFMWTYDPVTEEFRPLAETPEVLQGSQALAYDSANDVVIALGQFKLDPDEPRSKLSVQPWALDVRALTWRELKPSGPRPEGYATGSWAPLCYDRDHNAFLFLNRTTQTGCETWAYRYRRAGRQ